MTEGSGKVAVISAINPGNTGMFSVDLAAVRYFTSIGRPFDLVRFQGYQNSPNRLGVRVIRDLEELATYESVAYWGDFQNNPMYGLGDFSYREVHLGYSPDRQAGGDRWVEFYLTAPERLEGRTKFVSLGNCFLGAPKLLERDLIGSAFRSFVSASQRIVPREDQSLRVLREISDPTHQTTFAPGMDMATLLASDRRVDAKNSTYFAYSFGRSGIRDARLIMREIAVRTQLTPIWVPWLDISESRLSDGAYAAQCDTIASAQFMITDIYHCALNTLNVRTPLICVARPGQETTNTLSDFKKIATFDAYGLSDILVYPQMDGNRAMILEPAMASIEGWVEKYRSSEAVFEDKLRSFDLRRERFRASLDEIYA